MQVVIVVKVAIFSNTAVPSVNGVAISIEVLRRTLLEMGLEVHLLAPAPAKRWSQEDDMFHCYPSIALQSDYRMALLSRPIERWLATQKFDVIHAQHPNLVGRRGLEYAEESGTPSILTIHTQYRQYIPWRGLRRMFGPFVDAMVRRSCSQCTLVTTPGTDMQRELLDMGVQDPLHIPNPVDLDLFTPVPGYAFRKLCGVGPRELLIGYVGRLSPEKGLELLIEAAGLFLPELPAAKLVIVGDGPSRSALEHQAVLQPDHDRIIFTGQVPHDRVAECYGGLDAFVSPSTSEVNSLTFLEALACGAPPIVMDAAGSRDMVVPGINGVLVPVNRGAAGIATAIVNLASNKEARESLSRLAIESARRYDRRTVASQWIELYERAIREHRKKQRCA